MSLQQAQASNTAVGAAGSIASSIQGFRQAMEARRALKAQAKVVEANAAIEAQAVLDAAEQRFKAFQGRATEARLEAARLQEFGEARAAEIRDQGQTLVSSIKANAAARGIRRVGSPLEVAAEAIYLSEQAASQLERDVSIQADERLYTADQLQLIGQTELVAAAQTAQGTILNADFQARSLRAQRPSVVGTAFKSLDFIKQLDEPRIRQLYSDFGTLFPSSANPFETRLEPDSNFDEMLRGEL